MAIAIRQVQKRFIKKTTTLLLWHDVYKVFGHEFSRMVFAFLDYILFLAKRQTPPIPTCKELNSCFYSQVKSQKYLDFCLSHFNVFKPKI